MPKLVSPLAQKRRPRHHKVGTLIKQVAFLRAKLKERKKTKHSLPSSRMWPGQVKAGTKALLGALHPDAYVDNKKHLYLFEAEKVTRAVFKACVEARVERARILKRRAAKRKAAT